MFVFLFCMFCFPFCVFSDFVLLYVLLYVLFLPIYIAVYFISVYSFTARCQRVET